MKIAVQSASGARRGFALVFALAVLAMLLTFLLAAQGSVVVQGGEARRQTGRDAVADLVDQALRAELARARAGQLDTGAQPLTHNSGDAAVATSFVTLAADHPVYATSKYLRHHSGDRLAAVRLSSGPENARAVQTLSFLINPDRATPVFEIQLPEVKAP